MSFFLAYYVLCIHGLVTHHQFSPHGGRIVWTKPSSKSFLPCRFHSHIIHTKMFQIQLALLKHVVALNKRSMEEHSRNTIGCLKSDAKSVQWDSARLRVFLNLFTSERQHWRRRKTLWGWVSLWGGGLHWNVWQRLSIETGIQFIIWAVIRCHGKKTVNGDYSFIKSSFLQFSIALFLSLHTSLMSTMMKSLFWRTRFCLITFNEQWMIYHSNRSR